jgi:hypothetical protein
MHQKIKKKYLKENQISRIMVFLPIHFKNSNVISEKKGGNETFISIKIILILKETMRKKHE